MGNVFESEHPLVRHKLTVLRGTDTGVRRFRELMWEISVLLAYEALADLALAETEVTTPLERTSGHALAEQVALVAVLRAGLGMVDPIWNLLPEAQVGHIGLYRDEETLQPVEYYSKLPPADQVDVCLLLDPMLATGGSAVAACNILKRHGLRRIKFVGLIAAPEGIARLHGVHPDVDIHIAAADCCLNDRGYIMPGLGDAGDRLFGTRVEAGARIPGANTVAPVVEGPSAAARPPAGQVPREAGG